MHDILRKISLIGIVPVIKIDDVEKAVQLCRALSKGGIPIAEITFRTAQAAESIARVSKELPDMILGAGTVLTTEQVDQAVGAGAKFIVSPGLNPKVVEYCVNKGIPITPGCTNPSDVEMALSFGLDVVKFFPAEAAGGIKMIKAMAGPFGNLMFMPTGGIDATNLNDYLSFPKVLACGGSWMVPEAYIKAGEFDKIEMLTREAVESMLGFKLAHIGINCENEAAAGGVANAFSNLLGFALNNGNSSIFAANQIEVMKSQYLGTHGHIAIKTNYIDRAVNYLTFKGYKFNNESAKYDAKGNLKAIYLEGEIGGFAVHLVQ